MGRIPLITIGNGASTAEVAQGRHDVYLRQLAEGVRGLGKPVFLRYAHRMDDPANSSWVGSPALLPRRLGPRPRDLRRPAGVVRLGADRGRLRQRLRRPLLPRRRAGRLGRRRRLQRPRLPCPPGDHPGGPPDPPGPERLAGAVGHLRRLLRVGQLPRQAADDRRDGLGRGRRRPGAQGRLVRQRRQGPGHRDAERPGPGLLRRQEGLRLPGRVLRPLAGGVQAPGP